MMIKLILLWIALAAVARAEQMPDVVGEAFDLSGDVILYKELHYYSHDGLQQQVIYRSLSGEEIARKSLDYSYGNKVPAYRQQNNLVNESVEVLWLENKLVLSYSTEAGQKLEKNTFDAPESLVIDAGFNFFIQQQWLPLIAGEKLKFSYPVPTRSTIIDMEISRVNCFDEQSLDICFRIEADNLLISWLMDPIEISYHKYSQQLSRYRGLGNVVDAAGDTLKVDIRYYYPDQACQDSAGCDKRPVKQQMGQGDSRQAIIYTL
jgi:hypothetical protein